MAGKFAIYLTLCFSLHTGLLAQGFSQDMIMACQKFIEGEYVHMDVEIAVYSSHNTTTPVSNFKGKVVRGKGYYFVENGLLSMSKKGSDMVLINTIDKTVSYRKIGTKEAKMALSGMEAFDIVNVARQMDSLVNKSGKVTVLPAAKGQTNYQIDFKEGLFKSIYISFQDGFVSGMTYIYNNTSIVSNNKVTISYKNVSFEPSKAVLPFSPLDVISFSEKGKILLLQKYSKYELIIVKDEME